MSLLERLPEDILGQILNEVVFLNDFIRCGAVCMTFYKVFLHRKPHRIEQCNNEVPFIFIPMFTNPNEVIDSSSTNNNTSIIVTSPIQIFDVIFDQGRYTSMLVSPVVNTNNLNKTSEVETTIVTSYGYLATIIKEKNDIIIHLSNPITGHMISLPTIPGEDIIVWGIYMVVFSCNPCIYPDKCVVAYLSDSSIGVTRLGSNEWNKFSLTNRERVASILFHKGQLYALQSNSNLFAIEFCWESDGDNCDFQTCDIVGTLKGCVTWKGYGPYMVESLMGELLMIVVLGGIIKVFKLVITNDDGNKTKGSWDQIRRLGNGDEVLFLSNSRNAICSRCRNLEPASVSFLQGPNATADSYRTSHGVSLVSLNEERKASKNIALGDILGNGFKSMVPYWIIPTLK